MTVLWSGALCDCLGSPDWFTEQNRIDIVLKVPMHSLTAFPRNCSCKLLDSELRVIRTVFQAFYSILGHTLLS